MTHLDGNMVTVIGAVVVALISGMASFFTGRRSGKAEFITAVNQAAGIVIDQLQEEIARVRESERSCHQRLAEVEATLREVREELSQLRIDQQRPRVNGERRAVR